MPADVPRNIPEKSAVPPVERNVAERSAQRTRARVRSFENRQWPSLGAVGNIRTFYMVRARRCRWYDKRRILPRFRVRDKKDALENRRIKNRKQSPRNDRIKSSPT